MLGLKLVYILLEVGRKFPRSPLKLIPLEVDRRIQKSPQKLMFLVVEKEDSDTGSHSLSPVGAICTLLLNIPMALKIFNGNGMIFCCC